LTAVASGLRRLWYLTLAGGCFILTVIGVIVPGMPTVPFLLLTSYYLARSSPALHRRFMRSRFFGPILRDWERWGGLRWQSKLKLIGVTLAVLSTSLLLLIPQLGILVFILIVAAISTYAIVRLPGVPDEVEQSQPPRLALMAPAP
jgi:uncharacterized membrane protein YbaN (DUF454 family)